MNRGQAQTTDNSEYLAFVRQNYLNRLKDNLPKTVLDKTTWLSPPAVLTEVQWLLNFIVKQFKYKLRFYCDSVLGFVLPRHQRYCVSFTTVSWCGSMWEVSHPRKKHRWHTCKYIIKNWIIMYRFCKYQLYIFRPSSFSLSLLPAPSLRAKRTVIHRVSLNLLWTPESVSITYIHTKPVSFFFFFFTLFNISRWTRHKHEGSPHDSQWAH